MTNLHYVLLLRIMSLILKSNSIAVQSAEFLRSRGDSFFIDYFYICGIVYGLEVDMGCVVTLNIDLRTGGLSPRLVGEKIALDLIFSGVEVTEISVSGEGDVVIYEEFYTPESRQVLREEDLKLKSR